MLIRSENFNRKIEGKECNLFTLKNNSGLVSQITNYGGRVVSLLTPDRGGHYEDIVFGFDTLDEYLRNPRNNYGAIIGRYANRIGQARFELDGKTYHISKNEGEHQLHGGHIGFQNLLWDVIQSNDQILELFYLSKNGEQGFPGNLEVKLRYTLTDDNDLLIEYWANIDYACPVNLTHHSFFNLLGAGKGDVLHHDLQIHANHFIPVNHSLIPLGHRSAVQHTPMDFRMLKNIGHHIHLDDEQLSIVGGGYDHSFEIDTSIDHDLVAYVQEPTQGRTMRVYTNQPAVQFYSTNSPNVTIGKRGERYGRHGAFCLEIQFHPDSPNQPYFPNCILRPGEEVYSYCRYHLGTSS
jgi:aldose 1-epimerase